MKQVNSSYHSCYRSYKRSYLHQGLFEVNKKKTVCHVTKKKNAKHMQDFLISENLGTVTKE